MTEKKFHRLEVVLEEWGFKKTDSHWQNKEDKIQNSKWLENCKSSNSGEMRRECWAGGCLFECHWGFLLGKCEPVKIKIKTSILAFQLEMNQNHIILSFKDI